MKKGSSTKTLALAATLLVALAAMPVRRADAAMAPVPVPAAPTGGLWASGTIIGIAAFLGIYDLVRRSGCTGDVLKLGGPGFGEPIRPSDNVLRPQNCGRPR